jgi:hypothetical protein
MNFLVMLRFNCDIETEWRERNIKKIIDTVNRRKQLVVEFSRKSLALLLI